MQIKLDYRESHTAQDKGNSYQKAFSEMKYRKYVWSWEKKILNEITKNYLVDNKHIRYLDFACGTGRIIGFLEKNMFESIGIDISESMLKIALENLKKSKIINVDITRKNIFEDNYFDIITAFRFFLNAQPVLREEAFTVISKILKQDGYFVFNIHLNKTSIFFRLAKFYRKLKGLDSEINAVSIKEVTQLVEKTGLQIVSTYHFGLIPIFNNNTKIPIWLINPFDKFASKISFCKYFSRYLIFLCKKE
ncbi:MAG: class I SAM-dependent methyltransferase [Actinobacteria bacterium]|nr:class I SAM-dependent methyltransferase [Actinomycetota bacterium]